MEWPITKDTMEYCILSAHKIHIAVILALPITANARKIDKPEMIQTVEYYQYERYMNAKNYLEIGTKNISEKNFELAIKNLKAGIRELGKCYTKQGSIDETGNLIMLSKIREEERPRERAFSVWAKGSLIPAKLY